MQRTITNMCTNYAYTDPMPQPHFEKHAHKDKQTLANKRSILLSKHKWQANTNQPSITAISSSLGRFTIRNLQCPQKPPVTGNDHKNFCNRPCSQKLSEIGHVHKSHPKSAMPRKSSAIGHAHKKAIRNRPCPQKPSVIANTHKHIRDRQSLQK